LCPMATHVLLRPDRGDAAGFRDASIRGSAVSNVYASYFWADGDPADRRTGDTLTVLRPVFWLSFTLDQHLAEHDPQIAQGDEAGRQRAGEHVEKIGPVHGRARDAERGCLLLASSCRAAPLTSTGRSPVSTSLR